MTRSRTFALIPAAGMGKRMGASINKQYLQLAGMPIVARTISVFENAPFIDGIILVTPVDEIPYCREHVVEAHGFRKVLEIVPGGRERQNSVMNGLLALQRQAHEHDVVLIHDGVRPLISQELLREVIEAARRRDGALVAVPAKDTIKTVRDGFVIDSPDRDTLWQAQTPQGFQFGVILAAHRAAEQEGFMGTDDASLVERRGGSVSIVRGDYRNIKITTPEDIVLAEAFLAGGGQEKEDFISMFAHDMKNPLTALIGSIDIMREGRLGPVNEEQTEYLDAAIDSCNEVIAIIDNLRDVRRFEAGRMQINIGEYGAAELLRTVTRRFTRIVEHDGIKLKERLSHATPKIAVDKSLFSRVVANLLANAVKFTPEGGEIVVSCRCLQDAELSRACLPAYVSLPDGFADQGCHVRVSVRNTGSGLSVDDLDRIFARNTQSRGGVGREHGAVGLGLAFCKMAVEICGGIIWGESEAGGGSKFIIVLPCDLKGTECSGQ